MNKSGYFYGDFFTPSSAMSFLHSMMADIDRRRHIEKLENAGVVFHEEFKHFGVPSKQIPFEYIGIDFIHDKFYVCSVEMDIKDDFQMVDVYKEDGTLMFTVEKNNFTYLGVDDLFLVREKGKERYMLHGLNGTLTSEHIFRPQLHSKFDKDSDFCVLGYKDYSGECVINKKGEIVFIKQEKSYESLYLDANILSQGGTYYNLFTGEIICKSTYYSNPTLKTKEFLFVESDEQVFKIDKRTCEFEVFGEPKKKPFESNTQICNTSPLTTKEVLPKLIKQGRNELCNCGSGLKVKKCNCKK